MRIILAIYSCMNPRHVRAKVCTLISPIADCSCARASHQAAEYCTSHTLLDAWKHSNPEHVACRRHSMYTVRRHSRYTLSEHTQSAQAPSGCGHHFDWPPRFARQSQTCNSCERSCHACRFMIRRVSLLTESQCHGLFASRRPCAHFICTGCPLLILAKGAHMHGSCLQHNQHAHSSNSVRIVMHDQ